MCSVHLGKLQAAGSADGARRRPRTTGRPVHACGCAVVPAMCDHEDKMRHGGHSIGPYPCPDGQQTSVEPARSGLMCCCSRWLALTRSSSLTHTIALPKDLTCGIERATWSVPTTPSIRPPDSRYRLSVVEERGEARAAQSSARWAMVLLGAPTQPTYQSIPSPLSPPNSGKSNVQIYPAGTMVRTRSRRPQLPNLSPAQRHGSTRSATLGRGPDRQPTRSERMLKPAAHLRSTSTRHFGPGRTQHPEPSTQAVGRATAGNNSSSSSDDSERGLFLHGHLPFV